MQAASRESLVLARERLEALAGAGRAGQSADALGRLADELLSVARVLGREPVLRRALSDPGRSAEGRRGLSAAVFGRHVSDRTAELLADVAASRWSRPGDLLDALQLLGVHALLLGADRAEVLPDVEDELFRFSRIVTGSPALAALLGDHAEPLDQRAALVSGLLTDRARPQTVRLVELALAGLGGRRFEASLDRLVTLAAAQRDRTVAHVRVAAPLSEEQEQRLADSLRATYGRQISVQVDVDPTVMGGATVRIGDDVYDGSIARRLGQARSSLTRR